MAGIVYVGKQDTVRPTSVLRFVVFGAVGFGIGLAVAAFINTVLLAITAPMFPVGRGAALPPLWATWPPHLSWFVAGACGGAALGLALRSRKRVVALAVAGAVGFGVAYFIFFVLAFLFGFSQVGVGIGALGGLMLGLALADWRGVVLLGLAGMVGFGVSGALAEALGMSLLGIDWEQPLSILVLYVLVQGMVGVVGGATLGAALGCLEGRRSINP